MKPKQQEHDECPGCAGCQPSDPIEAEFGEKTVNPHHEALYEYLEKTGTDEELT